MINFVQVYMCPWGEADPFVFIERGVKGKFYGLTKASAYRLAYACRLNPGWFSGEGLGWAWRRVS